MIELAAGDAIVDVSPAEGGRVAQIRVAGRELLAGIEAASSAVSWGSYPMAPWAGRIRRGLLHANGTTYQLPITMPPHAIHGTAHLASWEVLDAGLDHVEMQTPLLTPFAGTVHQHLQLTPDALVCLLSVVLTDRAMPVTIGWHPWFRKPLDDRLQFDQLYVRDDDYIPSGELISPPERPWDDCLVGAHHPLLLHYRELTVTVSSDCDHWVVYDQPTNATCVEPQTGPPDAANLGLAQILEPGELLQRTMTIAWRPTGG